MKFWAIEIKNKDTLNCICIYIHSHTYVHTPPHTIHTYIHYYVAFEYKNLKIPFTIASQNMKYWGINLTKCKTSIVKTMKHCWEK